MIELHVRYICATIANLHKTLEKNCEKSLFQANTTMGLNRDLSLKEQVNARMQFIYSQKIHERSIYMQELKNNRMKQQRAMLKNVGKSIGPTWYYSLSVPQRLALDNLKSAMYEDEIEGRPIRSSKILRKIGVYPAPCFTDAMFCIDESKGNPMEMMAVLFYIMFGHPIELKAERYTGSGKIILSSILYLGLDDLIRMLREKFKPDKAPETKKVIKPREREIEISPYMKRIVATLYYPETKRRAPPPPLPVLDDLPEGPFYDEPFRKMPPPPPPPPPPKKRLPEYYCDALAGINKVRPHNSEVNVTVASNSSQKKLRIKKHANGSSAQPRRTYGLALGPPKKRGRKRKLVAPNTGLENTQYTICGVHKVAGRKFFVLGNVVTLAPTGELIHGGFVLVRGIYINIHCGYRAFPPDTIGYPCECLSQWEEPILNYLEKTKCKCKHYYDFKNQGVFGPDELPYFEKPTPSSGFKFNHDTIFNMDEKSLTITKEMKKHWETDSVLNDGAPVDSKDKKKKKKRPSRTNIDEFQKPTESLKAALRLMRPLNTAARLPELHLAPEVKEWMRKRVHGPHTPEQKTDLLLKSNKYWSQLATLAKNNYGHVQPAMSKFRGLSSTWNQKIELNEEFKKFTKDYRMQLFNSLAKVNNILWSTMFQGQFPDKNFREIYYSYLSNTVNDFHLINPYSSAAVNFYKNKIWGRRYVCKPKGAQDIGL